ncbi:hypothetical protein UFOVP1672_62 [uncultured Caudovirales phage]|uniref:Uncharacterized protein n=1 Tax=uncultured Caudovirales phage TaxID=2100421 RepID=A0A6J5SBF3_9CAUD|nr:hypothetical protein UFOVP988_84 [uncultured Caudovirales phage]CAB4211101.1 hypothetical protein UFOVP1425_84 [uncultured Caudovirales phage]CAB4223463.1 hypothetical protein UFOVP1672_62 [uncultured Caudovirales phage]
MKTITDNQAEVGLHVFERAKLGKAPFRVVGYVEKSYQASPDSPKQPGGTCDYCGTAIYLQCLVRSSDGFEFKVGCDCVARTGDAGLIKSYKNNPQVRAARRAKAKAKDESVAAEWARVISMASTEEKLSRIFVQGRPWVPGDQVSLFEDLKRRWSFCGASGRKNLLKVLTHHLTQAEGR